MRSNALSPYRVMAPDYCHIQIYDLYKDFIHDDDSDIGASNLIASMNFAMGRINGVWVHPLYRRQGIGTAMLYTASVMYGSPVSHSKSRSPMAELWSLTTGHPRPDNYRSARRIGLEDGVKTVDELTELETQRERKRSPASRQLRL